MPGRKSHELLYFANASPKAYSGTMTQNHNMNFFVFAILLILMTSCNANTNPANEGFPQTAAAIEAITDDSAILGHWTMCAEFGNGEMIQYNMCPTINFNKDGSGSKTAPDPNGLPEFFNWTLQNNQLKIVYRYANHYNSFRDTNYLAVFHKNSTPVELEIRQFKKGYIFYLGKIEDIQH